MKVPAPIYDVIIVGGGPAGLSAALMLGRCRRRVLLCDIGAPRNRRSDALHGFLTRDGVPPAAFLDLGRAELARYGVERRAIGVTAACRTADRFVVQLADRSEEQARFLLLATGVIDDLPLVPGLEECYGRSVFHCPYCDAWERRDTRLAVLGRSAGAVALALALRTWSREITLCTHGGRVRDDARARLARNGIAIRRERVERLDHADGRLERVTFASGAPLPCEALFFSSGQHPQSDLAIRLGCALTHKGTVRTGSFSDTNVDGVFVAGDASHDAQFAVVAASEGVKAAVAINQALLRIELA